MSKTLLKLTTICSIALSLGACDTHKAVKTAENQAEKPKISWSVSAERLLSADGFLSFAGLKSKALSPLEKHAFARGRVNPHKTRGHFAYTDYLRRSDMMAPANYRQLSLASSLKGFRVAALDMISGAAGIPAPAFKPASMAVAEEFQLASIQASDSQLQTPAPTPVDANAQSVDEKVAPATLNVTTAQKVAAILDDRIKQAEQQSQAYDQLASAPTLDEHALSVVNMRMGDYEDRTRLVLDLSAAAKFDYDLNNVNSVLTVHINDAGWDLDTQRFFDDHPLIQSYEVSQADKDESVTLEISLKQPSKMVMSGFVRPDGRRGHRIFFDVAAL